MIFVTFPFHHSPRGQSKSVNKSSHQHKTLYLQFVATIFENGRKEYCTYRVNKDTTPMRLYEKNYDLYLRSQRS